MKRCKLWTFSNCIWALYVFKRATPTVTLDARLIRGSVTLISVVKHLTVELSLSDLTTYMQDFCDRGSNPEIMHVRWRSTNWATAAVKIKIYKGLYCFPQKHVVNKIVNLMASQNRCSVSFQMWLDRTPSALSKQLPYFTDNGCLHKIVFIFKCDVKPLAINLFKVHDMYPKIRKYSPNIFKN